MAKNYKCKECKNNNNGWCNVKKTNKGLKDIVECKDYIDKNKQNTQSNSLTDVLLENGKILEQLQLENQKYVQFGKREMFYIIQRQILAIDEDNKLSSEERYNEFKKTMIGLEQILQINEKIHGIALDSEIDNDILEGSKRISMKWKLEQV